MQKSVLIKIKVIGRIRESDSSICSLRKPGSQFLETRVGFIRHLLNNRA